MSEKARVSSIKKNASGSFDVFVEVGEKLFKASEEKLSVSVKTNDIVEGDFVDDTFIIEVIPNYEKINGCGSSSKYYRDIINRIEATGRDFSEPLEDALFKNLIVSEEEFENIDYNFGIEKFAAQHEINFICVQYNGTIKFQHFTKSTKANDILKHGLIPNDLTIMDLGIGVYVIAENDEVGLDNLGQYFMDDENTSMAIISGEYTGNYIECVYGNGHEHYIVLPGNIPADTLSIEHKDLIDIFNF